MPSLICRPPHRLSSSAHLNISCSTVDNAIGRPDFEASPPATTQPAGDVQVAAGEGGWPRHADAGASRPASATRMQGQSTPGLPEAPEGRVRPPPPTGPHPPSRGRVEASDGAPAWITPAAWRATRANSPGTRGRATVRTSGRRSYSGEVPALRRKPRPHPRASQRAQIPLRRPDWGNDISGAGDR